MQLSRMKMPKLPNSDVWRMVKLYRKYDEWMGNIMVDALADEFYHPSICPMDNDVLADRFPGFIYQGSHPITVPISKWAREQSAITKITRYFHTHHPLAIENISIDWKCMMKASKTCKYVWQRIRAAKIIWELFSFQLVKMNRGHCLPSDTLCTYSMAELFKEFLSDDKYSWIQVNLQHMLKGDWNSISTHQLSLKYGMSERKYSNLE